MAIRKRNTSNLQRQSLRKDTPVLLGKHAYRPQLPDQVE